jgi:hypothetical protein
VSMMILRGMRVLPLFGAVLARIDRPWQNAILRSAAIRVNNPSFPRFDGTAE